MSSFDPVPTLDGHQALLFLLQVALLLLVALGLGRAARRIGLPAIVGELCAGVVLGPSLLGWVAPGFTDWLLPQDTAQFHLLDAFGQISVVLLVGVTGMHLDFGLVRRKARCAAKISFVGLVAPLLLGVACGATLARWVLDDIERPGLFAFFLGVALCLSAIPVIAKTMSDLGMLHRNAGQLALTAGMIDDAVGWLLLSVVASLAVSGADLGHAVFAVGTLVAFLAAAWFVGRPLSRWVVRLLARSEDDGVTVAGVVVVMLLTAAATQSLGLEAILGAFVAGALLGSSGSALGPRLVPLRQFITAILAPVFFATAGLRVDLTLLTQPVVLGSTLLVLAVATLGKFGGAYVASRHSGLPSWEACAVGAAMNARGVVDIIVAMVGLRLGVLTASTYTIVVVVAIATSLMAAPILRIAMRHIEPTEEEFARRDRMGAPGGIAIEPLAPVPLAPVPAP